MINEGVAVVVAGGIVLRSILTDLFKVCYMGEFKVLIFIKIERDAELRGAFQPIPNAGKQWGVGPTGPTQHHYGPSSGGRCLYQ